MRSLFAAELARSGLRTDGRPGAVVTDADLAPLPEAARRYLRFMGVVGRPRDASFAAHLRGRFRPGPDAAWKRLDALQYTSAAPDVARLFYMRLPFYGVPVQGRDTYLRGEGRMLVRPLDLFTVQDARGPELDLGELVTWLNDAVLLAPSMLLAPNTTWKPVDDRSFDLAFADRGNAVSARVLLAASGAPTEFHTTDRWYAPPGAKGSPVRTPWTTPVSGWRLVDGRMLPAEGRSVWKRPEGDLPYAEFRIGPGDLVYNVPPTFHFP